MGEESTITIGGKTYKKRQEWLLQQELLFYVDNPRVYSALRENGIEDPSQDEIQEKMCSMEHVKILAQNIEQNGGLIEPLIVIEKDGQYVVIEGNSRLAAYRILAEKNPAKWAKVIVDILPPEITDNEVFTLLGTIHLVKKKDWSKFEQAAYVYRQKQLESCSDLTLAKRVGLSPATVKKYIKVYEFMVKQNDTIQPHWNMYEQYVSNSAINKYRETYPELDDVVVKQIKTGGIKKAEDIRDKLGKIAKAEDKVTSHIIRDYADKKIDLDEAFERFIASGKSNDNYQQIKKMRSMLTTEDFRDAVINEAIHNGAMGYELKKLINAVLYIKDKLEKYSK